MNEPVQPWIEGPTAEAVRGAVRRVAPELSGEVRLRDGLVGTAYRRWLPPIEATPERPVLAVAEELAQAFATLHDPEVLAVLTRAVGDLAAPTRQAGTGAIRRGLGPLRRPGASAADPAMV